MVDDLHNRDEQKNTRVSRFTLALFAFCACASSNAVAQDVDVKGGFFDRTEVGGSIVGEVAPGREPAPAASPFPPSAVNPVASPVTGAPVAGAPEADTFDRTAQTTKEKRERPVGNAFGARPTPPQPRPKSDAPAVESTVRPIEEPKDLRQVNPKDAIQMMDRLRGVIDQARTTQPNSTSQGGTSRYLQREIKGESPLTSTVVNTETPDKPPVVGYVDRPVLSVFVSGLPESHLVQTLRTLRRLREQYDVQIGEILIFGGTERLDSFPLPDQEATKANPPKKPRSKWTKKLTPEAGTLLASLGKLSMDYPFNYEDVLSKYGVETSPAWIVRVEDTDYVFEGDFDPAELFDSAGKFIVPRK